MSGLHFVEKCIHGTVGAQCRCPAPEKTVKTIACPPDCPAPKPHSLDKAIFQSFMTEPQNGGNVQ